MAERIQDECLHQFLNGLLPNLQAKLSRPLVNLTKKDVDFCWNESFQQLKLALITPPVRKYPNFKPPFILVTNASNVSLGAILAQKYDIEHPVWYASRYLKGVEKNYSTMEKECLTVI